MSSTYNYTVINLITGKPISQTDYEGALNSAELNSNRNLFVGIRNQQTKKLIDIFISGVRFHIMEHRKDVSNK